MRNFLHTECYTNRVYFTITTVEPFVEDAPLSITSQYYTADYQGIQQRLE